ncbi:MAG: hypothetical protein IPJ47_16420 [Anaerolineales bacterium]|nr:hypothetical protein [Anaerolineales bacterium]
MPVRCHTPFPLHDNHPSPVDWLPAFVPPSYSVLPARPHHALLLHHGLVRLASRIRPAAISSFIPAATVA